MPHLIRRKFYWNAENLAETLGLWFGVAFVTAACVVFFHLTALRQLRQETLVTTASASATQPNFKSLAGEGTNPTAKLAQFHAFFPGQDAGPDLIAKLYAAAAKQNLLLEQANYRLIPAEGPELLSRYEIVLPVKGTYVPLRRFIAQALVDVPNMSLDRIIVGRKNANDATLEAELSFTLYLGK